MDKKGFTLVELLAVITIISLITIVAVPSALTFQENMKKKMFCSKVDTIERAGRLYGDDVMETIKGEKIAERKCSGIEVTKDACQYVTVNTLMAKGLLKKEKNNGIRTGKPVYNEFYDPRNYVSMKGDYVIVYIENDRAYARYVYKNRKDSDFCNKEDADRKAVNPTKIYGYYYEAAHSSGAHGKVEVW